MQNKKMTAQEAVLDFEKEVFPGLFAGDRRPGNKEYMRCWKVIQSAKAGTVTDSRAIKMLRQHGGGRYIIGVTIEIDRPA